MAEPRANARRLPATTAWMPVWMRNLRVWRSLAAASLAGNFGEPVLYLLALGYGLGALVGNVDGMPYLVFLATGIVCSSAMMSATFEATYSAYTRMEAQGTWDAMTNTPLEIADVVLGEIAWAATKSLISATAILVVAALLGAVSNWLALWALPVVLLAGLCFAALAMVVTTLSRGYDFFLFYTTLCITPMLLISGVFFPIERMPVAVRALAEVLPLRHAVAVVRPLMTGTVPATPVVDCAVLAAYAVAGYLLAAHLARRRLEA